MIYAAADLHGNLPEVPADAKLLLLAGDICPDLRSLDSSGSYIDTSGSAQGVWLNGYFRQWLEKLHWRGVEVIAIWGNHDFVGEQRSLIPRLPWTLLEDSGTTWENLRIYGTPWVPGLPYWAFFGDDRRLKARADGIPDCDILMTHGPPHGFGDYIPTSPVQKNKYGNHGGENVGDPTLNEAIKRVLPDITICGHIHEARGYYDLDGNTVINVAAVDAAYKLHKHPFTKLHLSC